MNEPAVAFLTLHEIVRAARRNLAPGVWDYVVGGAETETTLKRNRQALDSVALRPRVVRDMSVVDPSTTFLGTRLRIPVVLAPIGSIEDVAPGGGVAMARAAAEFGVLGLYSSVGGTPLAAVAAAADGALACNLYVRGDTDWLASRVRDAIETGCRAVSICVDSAVYGRRERDLERRYRSSARRAAGGPEFQASFNWDDVKWLKERFDIPLVLKGIQTGEDAAIACEHGVEVVYVSNHGGRQLDHGEGTLTVLSEVVEAVAGRSRVVMDGGVSRGTDVLKAVARGADAVGIGRLQCYGLAAAGQAGLVRVLELLEEEIQTSLMLIGAHRLADLDDRVLTPASPVDPPHVLSAFPLLDG